MDGVGGLAGEDLLQLAVVRLLQRGEDTLFLELEDLPCTVLLKNGCLVPLPLPHLVQGVLPREDGSAEQHLRQDAPEAPQVHPLGVVLLPHEDLRRPVPPGCHVVRQADVRGALHPGGADGGSSGGGAGGGAPVRTSPRRRRGRRRRSDGGKGSGNVSA